MIVSGDVGHQPRRSVCWAAAVIVDLLLRREVQRAIGDAIAIAGAVVFVVAGG